MVRNAAQLVAFLIRAFDGRVVAGCDSEDGALARCEMQIGDSIVVFGEAVGRKPHPITLAYQVDGHHAVDLAYAKALAAGATSVAKPEDQPLGHRSAVVQDLSGNQWTICTSIVVLPQPARHRRLATRHRRRT